MSPEPRRGRHARRDGTVRQSGVRAREARDNPRSRGGRLRERGLKARPPVALPPFHALAFHDKETLRSLPDAPGVVELLGTAGIRLLLGRPANIRRWTSSRLSRRRPSRPGGRPPLDLTPITTEIR